LPVERRSKLLIFYKSLEKLFLGRVLTKTPGAY